MSLARAGQDFLPFLRAGSAVLARTTLLLGTKTIATAVATRCGTDHVLLMTDVCIHRKYLSSRGRGSHDPHATMERIFISEVVTRIRCQAGMR